jgi:Tol biopolymer transport system component
VWSPDGKEIAFEAQANLSAPTFINVVQANGRHKRKLAKGRNPTWSPDARRLAFISNYRLVTIRADGTGRRLLSRESELVFAAAWSPKGNTLALVTASSRGKFGGPPSDLRVEIARADRKQVRVLVDEPAGTFIWGDPVWTPDGKRVIVAVG